MKTLLLVLALVVALLAWKFVHVENGQVSLQVPEALTALAAQPAQPADSRGTRTAQPSGTRTSGEASVVLAQEPTLLIDAETPCLLEDRMTEDGEITVACVERRRVWFP